MPTTKKTGQPPAKPPRASKARGEAAKGTASKPAAKSVANQAAKPADEVPVPRHPGFRLVQRINFEMARRGITQYAQVSAEMGFTDDPRALYLSRMQTGTRFWNSAGLDRLRMVATWLDMAPLEVMMLADAITPDDALVETLVPHELDRCVFRIAQDPEYGKMLPHYADLSVLPPWAKVLLLLFYDDVNRFKSQRIASKSGIPEQGLLALARRLPK